MKRGFSLVEMAMVVAISGLMVGFLLQSKQGTNPNNECYSVTRSQLNTIRGAVDQFAHKNNRLPMPAARNLGIEDPNYGREALAANIVQAAGVSFGAVPFQALGLSPNFGSDCWGNKLSFAVTTALTTSATSGGYMDNSVVGNITLESTTANPINTTTAYAIISHGEDGLGAVKANYTTGNGWCSGGATLKYVNCLANAATVADAVFNNGKNAGANYFDDIVITGGKPVPPSTGTNLYCWGTDSASLGLLADNSASDRHYYTPNKVQTTVQFSQFDNNDGLRRWPANGTPCALTSDGTAYCWGYNYYGAVGDDNAGGYDSVPTAVNTTLKFSNIFTMVQNRNTNMTTHCGISKADSTAWCWGFSGGQNYVIPSYVYNQVVPHPVQISNSLAFTKIIGDNATTTLCGLTTGNQVYCTGGPGAFAASSPTQWYNNTTMTPILVSGTHKFADIIGDSPMCGLTNASDPAGAGKIFCWGLSGYAVTSWETQPNNNASFGILPITITNITQGNPGTVTYTTPASGLQLTPGDEVYIQNVKGMDCVNNVYSFTIHSGHYTANTFDLSTTRNSFTGMNTTGCSAYTSGGYAVVVGRNTMTQPDNVSGITFTKLITNHSALSSTGKLYGWGQNTGYLLGNGTGDMMNFTGSFTSVSNANPGVWTANAPSGLSPGDQIYLITPYYNGLYNRGAGVGGITLASSASSTNSTYNGQVVGLTGGTGALQIDTITAYTGASRFASVATAWTTIPDSTTTYVVGSQVKAQTGGSSTTIKLNASASSTNSFYNGQTIFTTSGTGSLQVRTITAYTGATKIATVNTAWTSGTPNNTTYYLLGTQATAQAGKGPSIILDASSSNTDNYYTGHQMTIDSMTVTITGYTGATQEALVNSWPGGTPNSGDNYNIDPLPWGWYTVVTTPNSTDFTLKYSNGAVVDTTRSNTLMNYTGGYWRAPTDGSCYSVDYGGHMHYCSFTPVAATQSGFTFTDGTDGMGMLSVFNGPQGVYTWGGTYPYQGSGDGSSSTYTTPNSIPIPGNPTISSLYYGYANTCAISTANDAYCWGLNYYGQLATGDQSSQMTPSQITGYKFKTLTAAASGGYGYESVWCGISP